MRLNWIDSAKIRVVPPGEKAELVLGPLEDSSAKTLVVKIPITASTYYLVENRQPIGFDKNLPGSGVLVLFADDSVAECRHGKAPVKLVAADPSVPHLEGAAFEVGGEIPSRTGGTNFAFSSKKRCRGPTGSSSARCKARHGANRRNESPPLFLTARGPVGIYDSSIFSGFALFGSKTLAACFH